MPSEILPDMPRFGAPGGTDSWCRQVDGGLFESEERKIVFESPRDVPAPEVLALLSVSEWRVKVTIDDGTFALSKEVDILAGTRKSITLGVEKIHNDPGWVTLLDLRH